MILCCVMILIELVVVGPTSDTPSCLCGLDRDSVHTYFLLYCNNFKKPGRNQLNKTLKEISESSDRKKQLCLSEALLLAPKNDYVTSHKDKLIEEAMFDFTSKTRVKL